ncbi:MAG: helix-turn-helix domain-containing protein [Planctomycetia bacterium]|nr:helix-turn-helix domain-containing protein [Planctomycetia bacterium]
METQVADKMLVGAPVAAAMLSICPKSLWNYTAPRGTIPSITIGTRRLYDPRDLREWIESRKGGVDG